MTASHQLHNRTRYNMEAPADRRIILASTRHTVVYHVIRHLIVTFRQLHIKLIGPLSAEHYAINTVTDGATEAACDGLALEVGRGVTVTVNTGLLLGGGRVLATHLP